MTKIIRIVFEAPLRLKNLVKEEVRLREQRGEYATQKLVYTEMLEAALTLPKYAHLNEKQDGENV